MNEGIPLIKDRPIKASEAIAAFEELKLKLTKREFKQREIAFQKAEQWILRVAAKGVIGPIGNKYFNNPGIDKKIARVDIEVLRGEINLIE